MHDVPDTLSAFRYFPSDSIVKFNLVTHQTPFYCIVDTITFVKDTGVTNVSGYQGDFCTGVFYTIKHELTSTLITGTSDRSSFDIPNHFTLSHNYPNPFNPSTTIQFTLPHASYVTLKIYNLLGEEVATLVSEQLSPGTYTKQWSAEKFASGIYYYRIQGEKYTETKKLLLVK
jgi:hypothetical protein